jgi:hypothetical protein
MIVALFVGYGLLALCASAVALALYRLWAMRA